MEGAGRKFTILVVDDTPESLAAIGAVLRDDYAVKVAGDGENALRIARSDSPPDLVLLDVVMPGMDGYEACRRLKADPATRDIPVLFLTALAEVEDERRGLELGAVDFIVKPASPAILTARVRTHLALKASADFLRDKNVYLAREVERRTAEVRSVQETIILALASLAETRDNDTGNHLRRTQRYVRALALRLKEHPRFRAALGDSEIEMLYKSAPLHDIGKVGIPDAILLKPGKLEPAEFEVMKTHTTIGRDAIARAEQSLGSEVGFLRIAKEITLSHQEKWDGSGYPQGLRGEAIPLSARLMAVADVYDALSSRRVYRPPMPHEKAARIVLEGRGTHFDPDVVDAFVEIQEEFREIARQFLDSDLDLAGKA